MGARQIPRVQNEKNKRKRKSIYYTPNNSQVETVELQM